MAHFLVVKRVPMSASSQQYTVTPELLVSARIPRLRAFFSVSGEGAGGGVGTAEADAGCGAAAVDELDEALVLGVAGEACAEGADGDGAPAAEAFAGSGC